MYEMRFQLKVAFRGFLKVDCHVCQICWINYNNHNKTNYFLQFVRYFLFIPIFILCGNTEIWIDWQIYLNIMW